MRARARDFGRKVTNHLLSWMAREPDSFPLVHPTQGQYTQILVAEVGGDLHSTVERRKEGNTEHTLGLC